MTRATRGEAVLLVATKELVASEKRAQALERTLLEIAAHTQDEWALITAQVALREYEKAKARA